MDKKKAQYSNNHLIGYYCDSDLHNNMGITFSRRVAIVPDYAPQDEEVNAEEIPDDNGEKMELPEGGGSVSLTYAREVNIDLSEKSVSLLFANPGKSNQDIVLQLEIQDNVVVQSGTLSPGKQVTRLDLSEESAAS